MKEIDQYYSSLKEPQRSFALGLRDCILNYHMALEEVWKYNAPMFTYLGKTFCYIWFDRKYRQPYVGLTKGFLIDHPALKSEGRTQIKVFAMNIKEDIPVPILYEIFDEAIKCYKQ